MTHTPHDPRPILITGGAGFVGTHLVRLLATQHHRVRLFDLPDRAGHLRRRGVEIVEGDIRDAAAVRSAVTGCRIVLHLAANPNLWARQSGEFDAVNHQGTLNVLEAAAAAGVERVVHVSTESILTAASRRGSIDETTPLQPEQMIGWYCRSKANAELAAMRAAARGQPVVVVSPTVPVGAGDRRPGPMSRLILHYMEGRVRGYLDGEINLIDVRDVAEGIWAAAQRGRVGRRYLLAGENMTILQLFHELAKLTARPAPTFRVPYSLALAFAWGEEHYCRLLPDRVPMATVTGVRLTRRCMWFDGSASRSELGLTLRPWREALRLAVAWFEQEQLSTRTAASVTLEHCHVTTSARAAPTPRTASPRASRS